MKKLLFIAALFFASMTADAQCINFKLSGADQVGPPSFNETGDSIVFNVQVVTYIEKIGKSKFEQVNMIKVVFPIPFTYNETTLPSAIGIKADEWVKKNYPPIN